MLAVCLRFYLLNFALVESDVVVCAFKAQHLGCRDRWISVNESLATLPRVFQDIRAM